MIQFASEHTEPLVRRMWKICFGDTDEFIDLFFSRQYKHGNTLIYFEGDEAVASLQMIPYTITFYGAEIPFVYLAGLCTLPEHRNKGYMGMLIKESHKILKERGVSLAILVPAEDWLFGFYEKYGYEKVFDRSEEPICSLSKLLQESPDLETAYAKFDNMFRNKDFCVQKSFQDFETIVEEYINDGSPEKHDLAGMACIIDEEALLKLYALKNEHVRVCMRVIKGDEDMIYTVDSGIVKRGSDYVDLELDIRTLCKLLFGYRTDLLEEPLKSLFPLHHPVMNLMLE